VSAERIINDEISWVIIFIRRVLEKILFTVETRNPRESDAALMPSKTLPV
jgi:hypothetical protein